MDILQQTPAIPDNSQWALFLRNHDELTLEMVTDEDRDYMYRVYAQDPQARINLGIRRRLAPLLQNHRRKIELMNGLLFSLPGTPVIYYGDEIGMGDNIYLGDRNGVRTPMQWSPDRNAGFSTANPQRLYLPLVIDPEFHYRVDQRRNAAEQRPFAVVVDETTDRPAQTSSGVRPRHAGNADAGQSQDAGLSASLGGRDDSSGGEFVALRAVSARRSVIVQGLGARGSDGTHHAAGHHRGGVFLDARSARFPLVFPASDSRRRPPARRSRPRSMSSVRAAGRDFSAAVPTTTGGIAAGLSSQSSVVSRTFAHHKKRNARAMYCRSARTRRDRVWLWCRRTTTKASRKCICFRWRSRQRRPMPSRPPCRPVPSSRACMSVRKRRRQPLRVLPVRKWFQTPHPASCTIPAANAASSPRSSICSLARGIGRAKSATSAARRKALSPPSRSPPNCVCWNRPIPSSC